MDQSKRAILYYTVRSPWAWCLDNIRRVSIPGEYLDLDFSLFHEVRPEWHERNPDICMDECVVRNLYLLPHRSDLPSNHVLPLSHGPSGSNNAIIQKRRAPPQPCTLRLDLIALQQPTIIYPCYLLLAAHGVSSAFDGCDDKDEFVRTIDRCSRGSSSTPHCYDPSPSNSGLTVTEICPPSVLLHWNASKEDIMNIIQTHFPNLTEQVDKNDSTISISRIGLNDQVAVLKAPLASRGEGVYFVSSFKEIWDILDGNRMRALKEPQQFLQTLLETKNRIPDWVLQKEVFPPMLIKHKKFHLRTYVIVMEIAAQNKLKTMQQMADTDMKPIIPKILLYNRHEVRIAHLPMKSGDEKSVILLRNRDAHITNGACSDKTERLLIHQVEELKDRNWINRLEHFVADTFGNKLLPDITRRVQDSYKTSQNSRYHHETKFALAGVDVMIDANGVFYMLEVNSNPAAPPEATVCGEFHDHLIGFMNDLIHLQLIAGTSGEKLDDKSVLARLNFTLAEDILSAA